MTPPDKAIQLTPLGYAALLVSVGVALAVRIALPIWMPDFFAPTDRKDPRHMNAPLPLLIIPLAFCLLAVAMQLLGYPVFRVVDFKPLPKPDSESRAP